MHLVHEEAHSSAGVKGSQSAADWQAMMLSSAASEHSDSGMKSKEAVFMERWLRTEILATGLICVLVTLHCHGQSTPQMHSVDLTIEQIRSRLDLSSGQEEQIRPMVAEYRKRMAEIRANLDKSRSTQSRRGLLLQVAAVQEELKNQVDPLLTDKQRAEWKKIRSEMRDELKERWRGK
jgi:hypothetical protein